MTLSRQALGRYGEGAARRWYESRGFGVLAANWRCTAGEIDLILGQGDLVVFCEVKTRSSDRFGSAAEAVDRRKQLRLRRCAASWFHSNPGPRVRVRFDVAAVVNGRVTVYPGAF